MFLIGENLNVINREIGAAFRDKNPEPIMKEAKQQKERKMDWIDINLGPARKDGPELMNFVITTVQKIIGSTPPLCIDTMNIDAIKAGLEAHEGRPIINSIMCRPERYEKMIPMAAEHDADVIALLWGPDGLPRDENERAALAVELIYAMNSAGIPNERIFVDGIVTPVNIQQQQLMNLLSFMYMLQDIAPGIKSTCGLSNISNGVPEHLRCWFNQTYMVMLERAGMYACIADAYDETLYAIAKGERPDIVKVIHDVQDGADIDINSLSKELQGYVKTAKVILGHTLYSDSWLEI